MSLFDVGKNELFLFNITNKVDYKIWLGGDQIGLPVQDKGTTLIPFNFSDIYILLGEQSQNPVTLVLS